MRSVFLFVLCLLAACTTAQAPEPLTPAAGHVEQAAALADKAVALVLTRGDGEVRAYCSGVWAGPRTILTANHCLADFAIGESAEYVTRGDVYLPGTELEVPQIVPRSAVLMARDEAHDLVALRASYPPAHSTAIVAPAGPRVGMFVQTMGQPLGLWWTYSSGEVSALRMHDGTLYVQTTAPISPGNSGGALFDAEGRIVGVCHGTFTRGQLLNLFIHPMYIDAVLKAIP